MVHFRRSLISVLLGFSVLPCIAADIEFVTQELPWAVVDKPYAPPPLEIRSSGACPLGGVSYAVVSGVLPPGIQFSRLGAISGVPLHTGTWEIAVRVSNGCTWTAKHFFLVVSGAPILSVSPAALVIQDTNEHTVRVSATWPKLIYTITSSAAWLTAIPERGFTPREGSALDADFVRVYVDPKGLPPGRHSARLMFSAWQGATQPAVEVVLVIRRASSESPTNVSPP